MWDSNVNTTVYLDKGKIIIKLAKNLPGGCFSFNTRGFAINKIITAAKQATLHPFCKYTSFVIEITCRWMFNVAFISFNIKFFFEYLLNSLMWFTI